MSDPVILERVGLGVLCYVVLLLMPVLARMSDQEDSVRMMASRCFAMLVNLMPLEVSVPEVVTCTCTSTPYSNPSPPHTLYSGTACIYS